VPGLLTLIGSGETAAGMASLHRILMARLASEPRPAFLDTPAGFELGLAAIQERFLEYFRTRLSLNLSIISYRSRDDPPAAVGRALAAVQQSNYLLAGPGSPTYAVRHWKDSPLFEAVLQRWRDGAQLVFASSAAVAIGRFALPVYEIYKVGQDLHWTAGLDILGPVGFSLAIVPHWDNTQGGTHDTRACFMGLERFARLRALLPPSAVVLGIDEHTACSLDLESNCLDVRGRGGVTLLRGDQERRVPAGEHASLADLLPLVPRPEITSPWTRAGDVPASQANGLAALAAARIAAGDVAGGLRLASLHAPADLASVLQMAADELGTPPPSPPPQAWIGLLLRAREALRSASLWAAADEIRQALAERGITLRDTPEGTLWESSP